MSQTIQLNGITAGRRVPERLSPSAITRFETCPRQFLLTDVERLPRRERPTPILVVANNVHATLERFFDPRQRDRTPEMLERILRDIWRGNRERRAFASRAEEAEYGRRALDMLAAYTAKWPLDVQPRLREAWVGVDLPHGLGRVYGKIDRLDDQAGTATVVDYKTGRHPLDSLQQEPAAVIYALAVAAEHGTDVTVTYRYLLAGDVTWAPDTHELGAAGERLLATIRAIREEREWPATPGRHCRWCPCTPHCPDRQ